MAENGTPIAFTVLEPGVPVVSASGHRFGKVKRVLGEPEQDIFHGLVVSTDHGSRFVPRDRIERLTTTQVQCSIEDADVPGLAEAPAESTWRRLRQGFTGRAHRSPSGPASRFVVVARCRQGAVFQTVWVPLASFKAIRLGPYRIQVCPAHGRLELIQRLDPDTLTPEELAEAARYPAQPLP